jgi:hypothetical protein
MSDKPAEHLEEEPQAERGEPGSRDTGSDEHAGGPVDRPSGGTADEETDKSVDAQGATQEDMPDMPSGDQGG